MNFRSIQFSPRRLAITLVVLGILALPIVVFATANVSNVSSANWDPNAQEWAVTGTLDAFNDGANTLCIRLYEPSYFASIACTDSQGDALTAGEDFKCTIPGSVVADRSETNWILQASSDTACSEPRSFTAVFPHTTGSLGPAGPNAITLQAISAANTTTPTIWLVAALLAGFVTLAGVFVLRKRSLR